MIEFIKNAYAFEKIIPDCVIDVTFCKVQNRKSIHITSEKFNEICELPDIEVFTGNKYEKHSFIDKGIEVFCLVERKMVADNEKE